MSEGTQGEALAERLRVPRYWAESLLAWSHHDDARGFIGVVVGNDGTGTWYACDLQNVLCLDGREKALYVSRPRAGGPGVYTVDRKALAVALATNDAIARIEMHDSDDVRVAAACPTGDDEDQFAQVREMMAAALRAEPCQHGRGFPYFVFGMMAAHLGASSSSMGMHAQPVRVGSMEAWLFTDHGRTSALVMGSALLRKMARRAERVEQHPTATVTVMADTAQVSIRDGGARMLDAYYVGELRPGEAVVADRAGVAWIVAEQGDGGAQ